MEIDATDLELRWLALDEQPDPDRFVPHAETRRLLRKWLSVPPEHRSGAFMAEPSD